MSTATTSNVPTGAWSVDPVHSRVEFEVDHLGVSPFRGGFSDYEARLVADDDGTLAVEGTARVESVEIEGDLREHLLSPDFFDAERHPEIGFRSTGIELGDEDSVRVTGELTIRERTEAVEAKGRITAPGIDPSGANRIGVQLEAKVDRNVYGLGWNMELPNGRKALGDEVTLRVSLELVEGGE